ncbi:MAG TPA: 50S ribosomal protein L29 [Methylococcaceae bacterium]|jgi:large subunit ribosomal protein L29|nr:50S ribosomal protein L29 [Methylococcaceae bacterium]HIA44563.1 50S ribosomal protein L29 [Methylococcaceae bacterium]HIN68358.1 50S ribosomal protein L29 [Methylococcales bacterium]HIO45628.1 50S ribosomal protein L29 [Methylococcales bacterium]
MKASELREKNSQELNQMLTDLAREQFNLRMEKGTGQLAKTDSMKKNRRDVARIHTILKEMTASDS